MLPGMSKSALSAQRAAPDRSVQASAVRSLAKAASYRLIVMFADTLAVYLLTGAWRIAVGFMIASNIYTTALYFLHERAWAHVRWGRTRA